MVAQVLRLVDLQCCSHLKNKVVQVSLVVASPPAPNKAWNITRITEFLPRRRRPLENTFFDKNASVVVIDHRANCSATQKL